MLPENLTAVLITFERSCIFAGETSMNIQWKGSDKSPFLRVYILSFLSFSFFFSSRWYDGLILPRNIIDLFLQGAKKKAFTQSILPQNHSVIVTCWFTIYTRITESLAADTWRFYDLILVQSAYSFLSRNWRGDLQQSLSIFYIAAFFCWSSLFSTHDFNPNFFLSLVILAEISLHLKVTQEQYHLS